MRWCDTSMPKSARRAWLGLNKDGARQVPSPAETGKLLKKTGTPQVTDHAARKIGTAQKIVTAHRALTARKIITARKIDTARKIVTARKTGTGQEEENRSTTRKQSRRNTREAA